MKYIIDVNKDRIDCSGQLFIAVDIPNSQSAYEIPTGVWVKDYTEPDRKAVEDEVWGFAWKVFSMNIGEYAEIFGDKGCTSDYREAKAKYDTWKKRNDEIRVGDEVTLYNNVKLVVVTIDQGTSVQGIDENGECYECIELKELKKTGRHFPEVEELMKKMRDTDDWYN